MGNNTSKEERLLKATYDSNVEEVKALLAEGTNKEWKDKVSEIYIV